MEENTTTQHGSESNTPHAPHSTLIGIGLVLGIAVLTLVLLQTVREPDAVGCTMEALLCPDGSAVGREGPSCAFTTCPQVEYLTGVLVRDEYGIGLIVPSNQPIEELRVPLVLRVSNALADFEGREVVARGTFTEGSTYEVTLEDVVADYRCPRDVACIEVGAITARVTFSVGTEEKTFNMPSDEVPQEYMGYRIAIAEVLPEAVSTETIEQREYRVGFRIERIADEAAQETTRDSEPQANF